MKKETEQKFQEAVNFVLGEFEKTMKTVDPQRTEIFGATLSKDQLLAVYAVAGNLVLADK